MATVQERKSKDGKTTSYRFIAFVGYDVNGKRIQRTKTWTPDPGMSAKKIEKEVDRIKTLFDEEVKNGQHIDENITFAKFADIWKEDYGKGNLKRKTYQNYIEKLERINTAIGHIKLSKLQPHHLLSFYKNLAEDGVKLNARYQCKGDKLKELLKTRKLTQEAFAELAGISIGTARNAIKGNAVTVNTVEAIAKALEINEKQFFEKTSEDTGLSSATVSYYHHVISSILTKAVQWEYIKSNPADRVEPPKVEHREADYLEVDECLRILDCLEDEPTVYKTLVTLIIHTGMRRGEALGLTWKDVDFDNGTLDINKERIYIRDTGTVEDTPKNDTSKRVITIPSQAVAALKEYKSEQIQEFMKLGNKWTENACIFTSWNGTPLHPDTPTKWFSAFLKRHGLPQVHLHSLRHTNASMLIANGVDIKTVSKRLGHSNTQTTGVIYSHAIRKADEMASEKLESLLTKKA